MKKILIVIAVSLTLYSCKDDSIDCYICKNYVEAGWCGNIYFDTLCTTEPQIRLREIDRSYPDNGDGCSSTVTCTPIDRKNIFKN